MGSPSSSCSTGLEAEAEGWAPELGTDMFPPTSRRASDWSSSARKVADRDWLRYLELPSESVNQLLLTTLGTDEIAGLLRVSGSRGAVFAEDSAFVAAALDRSEGDPFYLHYLADDVRRGRIATVADVQEMPQGVERYLESWCRT